ncbi:ABC transporter ATP-binding protein [Thioclava sediminum]|uniref:ABC transporter ATP-binding protein n=1 Tax=Thioclava sediminum TaxID=1915319 RepID=A0ABX3N1L5_9RHOB|nr:ATP-binding cassette domain-containing protein [Thioclava sediminum]OOY25856.1 ABC transporter ATP-binding protein [Thioclava sediminum]
MSDAPALHVAGLSHDWGRKPALRDVGFRVEKGRFCALLGPNGAGKSTLMSVLTGLIRPAPGVVTISGHDMARARRKALAEIGVVFQQPTLDLDRSVRANLRYFAALHGLGSKLADRRISEALDRLGMAERAEEKLRALNGGHRRRMEIARALLHRPRLLLLDEPTVGLDAPARSAITAHVHQLAQDGIAVLWATHLADELRPEDLVVVLQKGQVKEQGDVRGLSKNGLLADWFSQAMGETA